MSKKSGTLKDAAEKLVRKRFPHSDPLSSKLGQKASTNLGTPQKGGAFSANTMAQLFLKIYHTAGFEVASSHNGRRTFITELARKGVSVRVLAELAGHDQLHTTQRYIDVNSQQMSAAVELL